MKEEYIVSNLPKVERDFSFIVEKDMGWQDFRRKLPPRRMEIGDNNIKIEYDLIDIFEKEGKKTFTIRAFLQPFNKTMTNEEIETICKGIREITKTNKMKEWRSKVQERKGDERILKRLEDMGFKLKFGDASIYVDSVEKKGVYKSYSTGIFKKEGECPECKYGEWLCNSEEEAIEKTIKHLPLNKNYPIYIREASIIEYKDKYITYLRIFNNKL